MENFNDKMNKQVAFRGKLVRIIMPTAGRAYFNFANAILKVLYKGKKACKV